MRTVPLQLVSNLQELRELVERFVKALNYSSNYAKTGELYNLITLQKDLYQLVKNQFQLSSYQTIKCLQRVVKGYETKDNRLATKPLEFHNVSLPLSYPSDYRIINEEELIVVSTKKETIRVRYLVGGHFERYLAKDKWKIKSAILIERSNGKFYLKVVVEKNLPEILLEKTDGIIGIDVGMNFLAVTTDSTNKTLFYGGGRVKYERWKYEKLRQELQRHGTRAAKRKLRRLSGKEKRFVANENHKIAKTIVERAKNDYKQPVVVMEEITNVRNSPRKTKRGRRDLNSWGYAHLQRCIEYKALERGIAVIYVDPRYTSQRCPKCGHTEEKNRDKKNHWFRCQKCNYQSNDDRVASRNIRNRGVMAGYIRAIRGAVDLLNVTSREVQLQASKR